MTILVALAWLASLFVAVVLFLALSVIAAILFAPRGPVHASRFAYRAVSSLPVASTPTPASVESDPIESYPGAVVAPALATPVTHWVHRGGAWPAPLNPITNGAVRSLE